MSKAGLAGSEKPVLNPRGYYERGLAGTAGVERRLWEVSTLRGCCKREREA